MLRVKNTATGQTISVPEDQLPELLKDENYVLEDQTVPFLTPGGEAVGVDSQDYNKAISQGYTPESSDQIESREKREKFGSRPLEAGLAGLARSATLGISDQVLTKTGLVEPETLRNLEEENKTASLLGEVAGYATPGGLAGKIGKAAGRGLAGAAIEGAAVGLGQLATDEALDRADVTAENVLAYGGLGAALGMGGRVAFDAAGKAARSLGGSLAGKGRAFFTEVAEKRAAKIAQEELSTAKPKINQYESPYQWTKSESVSTGQKIVDDIPESSPSIKDKISDAFSKVSKETDKLGFGAGFIADQVLDHGVGALGLGGYGAYRLGKLAYQNPVETAAGFSFIENILKHNDDKISKAINGFIGKAFESVERGSVSAPSTEFITKKRKNEDENEAIERLRSDLYRFSESPELLAEVINKNISDLNLDGETNTKLSATASRAIQYLNQSMPSVKKSNPFRNTQEKISKSEIRNFMRKVDTVVNPLSVLERIRRGTLNQMDIDALNQVYPNLFNQIRNKLMSRLSDKKLNLPYNKRLQIQKIFNTPVAHDPKFTFQVQSIYKPKEEKPKQSYGVVELGKDYQTPTQRISNK